MLPLAVYEGLVKRFGEVAAVDGLTFSVPEGAVFGLLGPNGAGKTTAIRVLLGLAAPSAGQTSLLGARPGSSEFTAAVRSVGSLIEGPALYARATARQNMRIEATALGLRGGSVEIDDLLALVGLADRADSAAGTFSLGMKQRLGLAMALLGRPRLVVLDEPTNGLDPAGIVEIRELIKRLPERGTTALVSSHLLGEVQLMCDRAAIVSRGRMVAEGTIADLLARQGGGGFKVVFPPGGTERARTLLTSAGMVVNGADGVLTVTGPGVEGTHISRPLAQAGIYVSELKRTEATLEQVFLSLTGAEPDGG
ncbi:MAG: ABC transporter ATP-binding protein [Thermoleophilaceae bacterium]